MTWDLSKLYAGFDAPEFLDDVEALKRAADAAVDWVENGIDHAMQTGNRA